MHISASCVLHNATFMGITSYRLQKSYRLYCSCLVLVYFRCLYWTLSSIGNNVLGKCTYCSMSICFKVDANVKFLCFMVQMLHSSRHTDNRHFLKHHHNKSVAAPVHLYDNHHNHHHHHYHPHNHHHIIITLTTIIITTTTTIITIITPQPSSPLSPPHLSSSSSPLSPHNHHHHCKFVMMMMMAVFAKSLHLIISCIYLS